MRNLMMAAAALAAGVLLASAATAQISVGNPPGNTLAPATGAVVQAGPPAATNAGDIVTNVPANVAAEKYKTEIVCRTSVDTGSLIARKKVCLTRKQWQYVNDENQREAYRMVQDNTTKSGHN